MNDYYLFTGIAILIGFTGGFLLYGIRSFEKRQADRIERLIDIIAEWHNNA